MISATLGVAIGLAVVSLMVDIRRIAERNRPLSPCCWTGLLFDIGWVVRLAVVIALYETGRL